MIRPLLIAGALAVLAGAGTWWFVAREAPSSAGSVHASWRGSHRGEATLPGELAWCPVTRTGTLVAISNDTGLLITLHEPDSLAPAPHPVVAPELRDQAPRPSAIAAMRWVGDSAELVGYRSVSGLVTLTAAAPRAAGSLEIRMRAPVGPDTLVVRAEFAGVPVVASAVGCP